MLKNKEIQINSSLTELYKVEEFVETISDIFNINSNYYSTILISLDEAVRNAIEHGNKFDQTKKVTLGFRTGKGELVFSVSDEGNGFSMESIPDPTDPTTEAGIEVGIEVGKGLFLMKQLSDRLALNDSGNTISLHFKVSSINKELAVQRTSALKAFFKEQKQTVNV